MWGVTYAGGAWQGDSIDSDPSLDSEPWGGTPLIEAVRHVASGDLDAARRSVGRLRLDDLPPTYDLEMLAFAAHVIRAAGTDQQRSQLYEMLLPFSGSHIVVGGCASYFGAVDHHLGLLARSLGHVEDARQHFKSAAKMHDQLGASAWAERSRTEVEARASGLVEQARVLRRDGDVWTVVYGGNETHLPDIKGLRDLAVLLRNPGQAVHAVELQTGHPPQTGSDEILDEQAKSEYRRRLAELESEIDEAAAENDTYRAERARDERDAVIAELSAAVGLGGRDRRLGDERERARKAVTARIRDAILRIDRANPALAGHLRETVQTGTWFTYAPKEPLRWQQ